MASIYGSNYTKNYISNPSEQANMGEVGGVKKVLFDQVAAGSAADVLSIGKLPKGARVLEVKSIGAGSGAAFNVAPAAVMSAETEVQVTLGTGPSFPLSAWIEYIVD
jgi:predicted Abi (CAAX) family protease